MQLISDFLDVPFALSSEQHATFLPVVLRCDAPTLRDMRPHP